MVQELLSEQLRLLRTLSFHFAGRLADRDRSVRQLGRVHAGHRLQAHGEYGFREGWVSG